MSPCPEELVDGDVVANDLARQGKTSMEGHLGVQKPVDGEALGDEVDAQIGGEKKIRLAGFNGDACGDPAAIEIPRSGMNVMLGNHPTMAHGSRLTVDFHDAVDEHQRLVGKTHPGRIAVHRSKFVS